MKMNEARKNQASKSKPFNRFQQFMRGLIAVPKKEVEAAEAAWRANRPSKKKSEDA